jgi:hypothetical protein
MGDFAPDDEGSWVDEAQPPRGARRVGQVRPPEPPTTPKRHRVEGIDYSPEGIVALREELIAFRGQAYEQLPGAAGFIVVMTHTIALLADYAVMRQLEDQS